MFRNVCNCLSISRHLTLVSYENYYNTLFFLKQSALFILSSTSLDYMMKLSVWEGGITLAKVQIKVNDNGSFRVTGDVELVDSQGNVFPAKPAFSLCRCGLSKICLIATLRIKVNSSLLLEHQRQNNFTCDMHIFVHVFLLATPLYPFSLQHF